MEYDVKYGSENARCCSKCQRSCHADCFVDCYCKFCKDVSIMMILLVVLLAQSEAQS